MHIHEFSTVRQVIFELNKRQEKNKKVKLILGRMLSNKKTFTEIFHEHVKGTELESILLDIEEIPIKIKCQCGFEGNIEITEHVHFVRCPKCGKIADVLQGNELEIIY